MSWSSGILISAVILPSGPSSACPTFPLPRIRPSAIPFCWFSFDTSTAASVTKALLVSLAHGGHPQRHAAALSTRPPIVFRPGRACRDSARRTVRWDGGPVGGGSGAADVAAATASAGRDGDPRARVERPAHRLKQRA